ncbi:MAG: SBBP repeat-containing protein [Spirosomataceae bacterium]
MVLLFLGKLLSLQQEEADVFIAKYNINGLLQWVRSAGGTSSDYGEGITIDSSGNVYVTGSYQGTATFGNTTFTSVGLRDIFIVKYNGSGLFQWVRSARGLGDDFGMGIVVNGSSNVYVTGSYEGTTTFGNTILTTVGLRDVFVVRLDN